MLNGRFKGFALSALSLALALVAGPARAESVVLSCTTDAGPATWTLRIDYATGLVEELGSSGAAIRSATASISDNAIVWSSDAPTTYLTGDGVTHEATAHWEGHLDRLSGTGWIQAYLEELYHNDPISVGCRPGAQKF